MKEFTDTPQDAETPLADNTRTPIEVTNNKDDAWYENEIYDEFLDYVTQKFGITDDDELNSASQDAEETPQEEELSEEERKQIEARLRFNYECHTIHTETVSYMGMPAPDMEQLQLLAETREPVPCRLDLDPNTVTTAGGTYQPITAQVAYVSDNESPLRFVRLLAQPSGVQSPLLEQPLEELPLATQRCMTHRLNAGYPECDGTTVSFKLLEVCEWEEGLEATLIGELVQPNLYIRRIAFFDTRYALHKQHYRVGEIYPFSLSALAYATSKHGNFCEASLYKNIFSPWHTMGLPPPLLWFYAENYDFEGLIEEVTPFQWNNDSFYRLGLDLFAEYCDEEHPRTKQYIPLYVKKENIYNISPSEIRQGLALEGILWMQGHLVEDAASQTTP